MPSSSSNPLALGGHFVLEGESYTTQRYVSLQSLVAERGSDGAQITLPIQEIVKAFAIGKPLEEVDEIDSGGVESIPEADWAEAEKRHGKIQVLVEAECSTRELVSSIAEDLGRSTATIYRWRARFLKNGKIKDLAPHHPTGGKGKSRIDQTSNEIIKEVIQEKYLTNQKLKPTKLMPDIEMRCRRAAVPIPHINTVRRRIDALDERKRVRKREGKDAAKKYTPAPGQYPDADYPNAVWQIDHTPVDICIVDDVYRRNIGRCWITVAIDVFSRCVVGYYLSLDKPNATSVGMCIVHAILPKDGWLAAHGVQAPWPIWGRPRQVLADNDKTFRCDMVSRAAKQYSFDLLWRPVRTPHWGAHIERLLGTFNQEIHTLPGTTFSNTAQRGDYKPHKEAELTFFELEKYTAEYICGIYHQNFHTGVRRPPIKLYETGVLGDAEQIGVGLPIPEEDPARLRLDFMPYKECTVQSYGVVMDNITYYDPVLDPWIHAREPDSKRKRKFVCRRDPRDISFIWFLDPDQDRYFKVPYRRIEYPSLNLWELREIRKILKKEGYQQVDEDLLFQTYERLEEIRQSASQSTQEARKSAQKKKVNRAKLGAEKAQVDAAKELAGGEPSSVVDKTAAGDNAQLDEWDDDDVVPRFTE